MSNLTNMNDLKTFANYDELKKNLTMQAIPIKGNEEMLAKTPHREMEDIAIIYRVVMRETERGTHSAVVSDELMKLYNVTPDELYADAAFAMKHTRPYEITPLFNALLAMDPSFANQEPDNMLYLGTSESKMYGAGIIGHPDFMEDAAAALRGSFFILPSSIHEVLLLPDDGSVNYRELMSMVTNINATLVSPEEKLTDNVYHYDAGDRVFETARHHAERMQEKEGRFSIMKDLKELKNDLKDKPAAERQAPSLGGAAL